jgi:glucose/arabinose dehydrogenase
MPTLPMLGLVTLLVGALSLTASSLVFHARGKRVSAVLLIPELILVAAGLAILLSTTVVGERAQLPVEQAMGPAPELDDPEKGIIPTVVVAPAEGWTDGSAPTAAAGLEVAPLATGLDHPRWIHVLPNRDVLVAETNAPPRPEDGKGVRGWIMGREMKRAGAAVPSANRISLLRDADGDGRAERRYTFLKNLNSPFGMALVGDRLYIANTDAIVSFPYHAGDTVITAPPTKLADLPGGPLNHHWTKNIIASPDGTRLYATVGSNSNVAENGMDQEVNRAAILEVVIATGQTRLFASGLRNPNGLDWEPSSGQLWTVVNERDELGSDLVPDYLTSVRDGGFYGWPYSYYGRHVDQRVAPPRPDLVAKALVPDFALGPHTASLGLVFSRDSTLSAEFSGGAFIGQHGSWNRRPLSGYRVIFVPFSQGKPSGAARDVLTGFVDEDGDARGRPVGVALDGQGALLVADDVGNTVWRVTARQ